MFVGYIFYVIQYKDELQGIYQNYYALTNGKLQVDKIAPSNQRLYLRHITGGHKNRRYFFAFYDAVDGDVHSTQITHRVLKVFTDLDLARKTLEESISNDPTCINAKAEWGRHRLRNVYLATRVPCKYCGEAIQRRNIIRHTRRFHWDLERQQPREVLKLQLVK